MNVLTEIRKYSTKEDKRTLLWLARYDSSAKNWAVYATCRFEGGNNGFRAYRVWRPTLTGRLIYHTLKDYLTVRSDIPLLLPKVKL